MRTGTRCTTFTQLPLAFWGGRMANCAPVPGLTDATWPCNGLIGKGIDIDLDRLVERKVSDVGLLEIGIDPRLRVIDHAEHGRARRHETAELNVVDLRCGAGDRRLDRRVVEIALRLVERSLRLPIGWKFLGAQISVFQELIECAAELLAAELELQLRGQERRIRVVDIHLG